MYDLIIRNGTIIDGSGGDRFDADIAIKDGKIAEVGKFDETPGTGITFQIDVDDAIGVRHQIDVLTETVEDRI